MGTYSATHMTAEELEKRIDELAHEFAKTHDEEVKAELEALRGRIVAMKRRLI
jgi:sensor histidine kinase YesM